MEIATDKYKQTEIGLIPEDWELSTIGEIFTFFSTANYSKAEMDIDGELGCVHYGLIHAIENSSYSLVSGIKYYVREEQAKYEKLQNGDVVMVDASEDLVGLNKSVEVSGITNKEYIAGLHTFHLRDKNSIYVDTYRGLLLNSGSVKRQMLRFAVGMKVFGVSKPQLRKIIVPVPTKAEQTAIATALSDMDSLISNLEKLIEKKRMILSGLIKKLTTPDKTWKLFKVKDIGKVGRGRVISHREIDQSINKLFPVYSSQTSNNGIMGFIDTYDFEGEYITWTTDGVNAGTVFHRDGKFNCTNVCGTIKLFDFDAYYISVLLGQITDRYVSKNLANPKLMNDVMKNIEIKIPSLQIQKEYGKIIQEVNGEIETMSKLQFKYHNIKQGMMQSLLTGKIRLI